MTRRKTDRFVAWALPLVLACPLPALAAAGQSAGEGVVANVPALPAPSSTIYWSVGKDGSLRLSDRPEAGGAQRGVQSFPNRSDAASLERAAKERAYWRAQDEAFAARQRERDRELAQRRVVTIGQADIGGPYGWPYYYAVPGVYRHPLVRGLPPSGISPGPGFGSGAPFVQSNSAPPGQGPAPFLSSGFASGLRR